MFDFSKSTPKVQRAINTMRAKVYDVHIMSHANRIATVVKDIVSPEEARAYLNELAVWRAGRDSIGLAEAETIESEMVVRYCERWAPNLTWMFQ